MRIVLTLALFFAFFAFLSFFWSFLHWGFVVRAGERRGRVGVTGSYSGSPDSTTVTGVAAEPDRDDAGDLGGDVDEGAGVVVGHRGCGPSLETSRKLIVPLAPAVQVWFAVGDVQRARGSGLIAGPGVPLGSVIVVLAVPVWSFVVWVPSTVFVPAITEWMLVTGMLFVPVVRTPAL